MRCTGRVVGGKPRRHGRQRYRIGTKRHSEVIDAIAIALRDEPGISALFPSGSHGTGMADASSDIEFVMVSEDAASGKTAQARRKAIERTGEIVVWWDRITAPVLKNAITEDWTRTDIIILKRDQMGLLTQCALKPVFDHDRIFVRLKESPLEPMPDVRKPGIGPRNSSGFSACSTSRSGARSI